MKNLVKLSTCTIQIETDLSVDVLLVLVILDMIFQLYLM